MNVKNNIDQKKQATEECLSYYSIKLNFKTRKIEKVCYLEILAFMEKCKGKKEND